MLGNKVYFPDVLPVWCRLQESNPRPLVTNQQLYH